MQVYDTLLNLVVTVTVSFTVICLYIIVNLVCFSSIYCSLGRTSTAAYYWFIYAISDIRLCRNLGKYLSGAQHTGQRKDFEVILMVKNGKIDTP